MAPAASSARRGRRPGGASARGRVGTTRQALAFDARLATCADDPRVIAGFVSLTVCAGASVFFEETFGGNGRTCGSCHPATHNTTLDVELVTALRAARPDDPLFVFEREPALANLETPELLRATGIELARAGHERRPPRTDAAEPRRPPESGRPTRRVARRDGSLPSPTGGEARSG